MSLSTHNFIELYTSKWVTRGGQAGKERGAMAPLLQAILKVEPAEVATVMEAMCSYYTLSSLNMIKQALLKSELKGIFHKLRTTHGLKSPGRSKSKCFHLKGKAKRSLHVEEPQGFGCTFFSAVTMGAILT